MAETDPHLYFMSRVPSSINHRTDDPHPSLTYQTTYNKLPPIGQHQRTPPRPSNDLQDRRS
ncbi:hypothetical protein PGTUg99_033086 [Puccinia graminis f. sp. tritici]|uniref:Uncharacterized protein n=1 Tax=Puccinia graminis f. sp. tritici TaxID=56615 RepID=A0A5B0NGP9_PUCGR|nr:hypothetical protein PGTUg99_033086 [Puccinia graminis f. sp. tritici]